MLQRLNAVQRVIVLIGAWTMVVQVYYAPVFEVCSTPPVLDVDPPHIQRPKPWRPAGRKPAILVDRGDYNSPAQGEYLDAPRLALELLITASLTISACVLVKRASLLSATPTGAAGVVSAPARPVDPLN
jgi:hypothetical protein